MAKKKLLFVMNNLNIGGAEKSLISLLKKLDFNILEVHLILLKIEGELLKDLPNEVKLLSAPKYYQYFDGPFINVFKTLNPILIFLRFWFKILMKSGRNNAESEQYSWKALRYALPKINEQYDVAIGYLEKTPNYFIIDKVKAKKKIGYVLNDYKALGMNHVFDEPYFEKLDTIVTDSVESNKILCSVFPCYKYKIQTIYNIVDKKELIINSNKNCEFPDILKKKKLIVSVGRGVYQKGYDIGYNALKPLFQKYIDLHWVIIGEGDELEKIKEIAKKDNLSQSISFLGVLSNPYPYMKQAFMFLHTARFEGYGIIVKEASLLNLPMVITRFNTANNFIDNEITGLIAELDAKSVEIKIEMLLKEEKLRKQLIDNLKILDNNNESLMEFYKLIQLD